VPADPPTPTPGSSAPATLPEALDALAGQLGAVAATLRDLLARGLLFDGFEHVRWQLLTVLNSLGLHEGTVRELRRLVERGQAR
jgi:hypothetical protein